MELKELVGKHKLYGVDFETFETKYGDAQLIRFKLGRNIYVATENPEDGYRSCMAEITISKDKMKNTFKPQRVIARCWAQNKYNEADMLELISVKTGKIVLEVGTDNSDDYYPSFVASFTPENFEKEKINGIK